MKTFKKWGTIALIACMAITLHTNKAKAQTTIQVSFQTFHEALMPYGHWFNLPAYGYAWVPDLEPGFQPYATGGHWEITEYGNTWVSDYPWGWAPFHYGRWQFDNVYGWIWIPGYEWGPAWVAWRSGGGYYGWAPLPPGVSIGVSVNIPSSCWFFVPGRYFTSPRLHTYFVPCPRVSVIYRNTRFLNQYYKRNNHRYYYGPRRHEIERVTGRPVVIHHIHEGPYRNTGGRPVVHTPRPNRESSHSSWQQHDRNNSNRTNGRTTESHESPSSVHQRPERRIKTPDVRTQDHSHISRQPSERPQRHEQTQHQRIEQNHVQRPSGQPAQQQRPQRQSRPQPQRTEHRPAQRSSAQPAQHQQTRRESSGRPGRR